MKITRNAVTCVAFFGFELIFLSYMLFIYQVNFTPVTSFLRVRRLAVYLPYSQPTNLVTSNNCSAAWFSAFLLIIVPVRPWDIHSRQLIRDTWFEGFRSSGDVALRFAVGLEGTGPHKLFELSEENGTFGDIVYVNAQENEFALTNKTLAVMKWAHHHVNFSYLLKSDDDTYVFVKNMIVELQKRRTTEKLYYGRMLVNSQPIRGKYKWADNSWDLGKVYLPFAMGGGYILSHDLVAILSKESQQLRWHINEDTAVGAWLSTFDHERRSNNKFCFHWKANPLPHCDKPVLAMLLFGYSRNEIKNLFHNFQNQVSSHLPINISVLAARTSPPSKGHVTKVTQPRPHVVYRYSSNKVNSLVKPNKLTNTSTGEVPRSVTKDKKS